MDPLRIRHGFLKEPKDGSSASLQHPGSIPRGFLKYPHAGNPEGNAKRCHCHFRREGEDEVHPTSVRKSYDPKRHSFWDRFGLQKSYNPKGQPYPTPHPGEEDVLNPRAGGSGSSAASPSRGGQAGSPKRAAGGRAQRGRRGKNKGKEREE